MSFLFAMHACEHKQFNSCLRKLGAVCTSNKPKKRFYIAAGKLPTERRFYFR